MNVVAPDISEKLTRSGGNCSLISGSAEILVLVSRLWAVVSKLGSVSQPRPHSKWWCVLHSSVNERVDIVGRSSEETQLGVISALTQWAALCFLSV